MSIQPVDYKGAFDDAPVGQAIARRRRIVACNRAFAHIFGGAVEDIIDTTFERLYPTQSDFTDTGDRVGPQLVHNTFFDERVMRRLNGDLIWVHVRGFTYTPHDPHEHTLWVFSDITKRPQQSASLRMSLTPRERDIAALLIKGHTGKEVARALDISPRTVDIYKTRLLRKYSVSNTRDLVQCLLAG